MELFLLLSMGMSIVAFISIALNQVPPTEQSLETYALGATSPLRLESMHKAHTSEQLGMQRTIITVSNTAPQVEEVLLATA